MASDPPWLPLGEHADLFERERVVPSGWRWRSVMVRAPGEPALIYSPLVGLDEGARAALEDGGGVASLLAPNHFHYMGIPDHSAAFPGAQRVASDIAAARLRRRTKLAFAPPTTLSLPPHVTVLTPPGLKTGEVWLRIAGPRGVTWVVSDAFFSVPETPRGVAGVLLRVTGTAPGLTIGRTFTSLGVVDARAYKAWLLAQLDRDRPTHVVPSHGVILHDHDGLDPEGRSLTERLRALVAARL